MYVAESESEVWRFGGLEVWRFGGLEVWMGERGRKGGEREEEGVVEEEAGRGRKGGGEVL